MLALENVSKRFRENKREQTVLDCVTLDVEAGELVVVWGPRRSGRTTLLRIAAGIEAPDGGTVRFQDLDLAAAGDRALGQGIGFVRKHLRGNEEQGVLEQVLAPLLARGISGERARQRAREALASAGALQCAAATVQELGPGETVRVALARSLSLAPALLVIDEPVALVELSERDEILALLRTLASEGIAVLASTGEPAELAGANRAFTLDEGKLRGPGAQELAPVVALRRRAV